MKVSKENRILVYKSTDGRLDVYLNVNGVQYKSSVYPNVREDEQGNLGVRDWGGNLYSNAEEG